MQIDTTPAPAGRAGKPALQALPAGCSTPRPPAGGTASCATMSSLSVAVVDPYTVARTALPLLLSEFRFVGLYRTSAELHAAAPDADVVLLEIARGQIDRSPFLAWTVAVRELTAAGYRVCIHTSERSRVVLLGCLTAGATAIVHKADSLDDLGAAVRAAAAGRMTVTTLLAGLAELAQRQHAMPSLTERQRMILSARARGEKFDSIARRLFISRKVAEEHWALVARKFAGFLREHSPADLERLLGLEPGDLVDRSPAGSLAG